MESTIMSLWHPINGRWRHLVRELSNNKIAYYTDGEYERTETVEKDGSIRMRK